MWLSTWINKEGAKQFAEEYGLLYFETSAKLDKNIRKAIACLLDNIIKSKENKGIKDIKESKAPKELK